MRWTKRKYDRIKISRQFYRVAFNWNAITDFMENCKMTIGQMDNFENLTHTQFIGLIYSAIIEGCRLERKVFPYTMEEFSAMLSPESVAGINMMFQAQNKRGLKDLKKVTN